MKPGTTVLTLAPIILDDGDGHDDDYEDGEADDGNKEPREWLRECLRTFTL